ncbi:MAG: hypothetical protein AAGF47_04200 [Planctomycetota bacterium]
MRYFREAGFNVPTINANNLWQGVEGEIDGWVGSEDMLATVRQLAAVHPDRPRIVAEMRTAPQRIIGQSARSVPSPIVLQRRLAEILAGGGQFILSPFAGGLTPAFSAGRPGARTDRFAESLHGADAPLNEAGAAADNYAAVRRLCTFASGFARVFAAIDQDYRPVLLDQRAPDGTSDSTSIVDLRGSQGSVAFVFSQEPTEDRKPPKPRDVDLMLGDGSSLTIPLGRQAVAWPIFDVLLGGRARLDYCTLNAVMHVGDVFVCYGPANASGAISINGAPIIVTVPRGKNPTTLVHEGHTLVIANEDQIDRIHAADDGVYLGVQGVDANGVPVPLPGSKSCTRVNAEGGGTDKVAFQEAPSASASTATVTLDDWKAVPADAHVLGTSQRFATIPGPGSLAELGAPAGYGWYRIVFKASAARRPKVLAPGSRDRLHLYLDGEPLGVMGYGPGAEFEPVSLQLKKGEHQLVVLAENLGRPDSGSEMDEPKGLVDHLTEVKPFRAGRHRIETASRVDLLGFKSPLWHVRPGDLTHPDRLTWSFAHRKKSPIILSIAELDARVLVILNDEPYRFLDIAGPQRLVLDHEALNRGNNTLQFALLTDRDDIHEQLHAIASATTIYEGVEEVTGKGKWAFAKWEPPAASAFKPLSSAKPASGCPAWYRVGFEADAAGAPVRVDLAGLTKGQVFCNKHHLGRYFLNTGRGASGIVSPDHTMLIPASTLKPDGQNDLMIFDERGASPAKVRVLIERGVRPIRA